MHLHRGPCVQVLDEELEAGRAEPVPHERQPVTRRVEGVLLQALVPIGGDDREVQGRSVRRDRRGQDLTARQILDQDVRVVGARRVDRVRLRPEARPALQERDPRPVSTEHGCSHLAVSGRRAVGRDACEPHVAARDIVDVELLDPSRFRADDSRSVGREGHGAAVVRHVPLRAGVEAGGCPVERPREQRRGAGLDVVEVEVLGAVGVLRDECVLGAEDDHGAVARDPRGEARQDAVVTTAVEPADDPSAACIPVAQQDPARPGAGIGDLGGVELDGVESGRLVDDEAAVVADVHHRDTVAGVPSASERCSVGLFGHEFDGPAVAVEHPAVLGLVAREGVELARHRGEGDEAAIGADGPRQRVGASPGRRGEPADADLRLERGRRHGAHHLGRHQEGCDHRDDDPRCEPSLPRAIDGPEGSRSLSHGWASP